MVVRDLRDGTDRLDRPDLVVRGHHRDEDGLIRDRLLDRRRVHPAELVDREVGDPIALLLEALAGVEDGVVLDRGGDDMVALLPVRGRHPLDRPVVGLRPARGEVDLRGACADRRRHPLPRLLDRLLCLAGEGIERGGVPEPLREVGEHHLGDLRPHRRRRRMVHIDRSFPLHPGHFAAIGWNPRIVSAISRRRRSTR